MKFLIISFLLGGFNSHDIQVAFFKLSQENQNFTMEIEFEKNDVESSFAEKSIELNHENMRHYLVENFTLLINNEEQHLSFEEIEIKQKHIFLKSDIFEMNEIVKSVEIKNTCLLNIENHSNIIEIRLPGSERDFLMAKNRTAINVNY